VGENAANISPAMTTQMANKLFERFTNVTITLPGNHIAPLANVGGVEAQPVFGRTPAGRLRNSSGKRYRAP